MFGKKQERNLEASCHQGLLSSLKIQLCPGLLSFLLAHSMEAVSLKGFLEGSERKKEVGKTSMQKEEGPSPREGQGGRSSGRDSLCLSVLIHRLKKSKLSRVAQMPFIGLTSMTSRGMGRAPLPVLAPTSPLLGVQDSPPGEKNVLSRARIKNKGLGFERGSG